MDNDNEGHSGYRIDQVAAGTDAWIAAAHPDLVLLNVGTNDTIQNYQLATAPDRLSALIDQILKDDPTATVMMSTLMPNKNATTNGYVDAFNAKLPAIAQAKAAAGEKVHLVDIHAALTLADIGSGRHSPDGRRLRQDRGCLVQRPAAGARRRSDLAGHPHGQHAEGDPVRPVPRRHRSQPERRHGGCPVGTATAAPTSAGHRPRPGG